MWIDFYTNTPIINIEQIDSSIIGFVYVIEFTDGTKYIGKKNFYSTRTLPALKSGKIREGAIRTFKIGKGKREYYDIVKKESNWKTYQGSHINCKDKIPKYKRILAYADSKLQLTYLEAKFLFSFDVLLNPKYLNDNILGTFYRVNLLPNNDEHDTILT